MKSPMPEEIRIPASRAALQLSYDGVVYVLGAEYLRVYSPSAQVRGHGVGQAILQTGKRDVTIVDVAATGNYALKISFSDGHDSGLYDWSYLHRLATQEADLWADYLARLAAAGASRHPTNEQHPSTEANKHER